MPFSVHINLQTHFPVITLQDITNGCEAEIYSTGALLNAFKVESVFGKKNIIDGFATPDDAAAHMTSSFKSAKLSPFVCRLAKGMYRVAGVEYTIQKFYLGDEAIHGLLFDAPFTIKDSGSTAELAFVVLQYTYTNQEEGFPFPYHTEVTYTLSAGNRLSIITSVTNTGASELYLNDGWHPYFSIGESVNNLYMQIHSNTMVAFDERLLPTGGFIPSATFEQMHPFGETVLDNCFVLKDFSAPACIIRDQAAALQLSVIPDQSYPYLQLYTPPHRKSIAIENLSSPPDSFNNGMGLIILMPGETKNFTTTYAVESV